MPTNHTAPLRATLFGKFAVQFQNEPTLVRSSRKAKELFAFLLLHHGETHHRDALAGHLWGEGETQRKALRQALWILQRDLGEARELIQHATDSVRVDARAQSAWVDTAAFEKAFGIVRERRGAMLDGKEARPLADAVRSYRGELLEGWYGSWVLVERDRFREMYLAMLDTMADHHEQRGENETALAYARLALQTDPANERMHCTVMRLLNRSGDRTGAIRQYEQCRIALRQELDVEPGPDTVALLESIRRGNTRMSRGDGC